MLDKAKFILGLKYLNAYYANFNFDIDDNFKIGIWYSVFETYETETYTDMIKAYCKENVYAPQSPTHILEYIKTKVIKQYLTSDEAWDYALGLIRRVNYDFRHFYQKCEYSIIEKIIKQIQGDFIGVLTEDLKYVKIKFVKLYENEVKEHAHNQTVRGEINDNSTRITHQETQTIGTDGKKTTST